MTQGIRFVPPPGSEPCFNCGKHWVSAMNGLCVFCHEIWRDATPEISATIKTKPFGFEGLRSLFESSLSMPIDAGARALEQARKTLGDYEHLLRWEDPVV